MNHQKKENLIILAVVIVSAFLMSFSAYKLGIAHESGESKVCMPWETMQEIGDEDEGGFTEWDCKEKDTDVRNFNCPEGQLFTQKDGEWNCRKAHDYSTIKN